MMSHFTQFQDRFSIENNTIQVFKGYFRGKPFFETCFECDDADIIEKVYSLLQMVYNMGEHEGRLTVRNNVKTALGLDL